MRTLTAQKQLKRVARGKSSSLEGGQCKEEIGAQEKVSITSKSNHEPVCALPYLDPKKFQRRVEARRVAAQDVRWGNFETGLLPAALAGRGIGKPRTAHEPRHRLGWAEGWSIGLLAGWSCSSERQRFERERSA